MPTFAGTIGAGTTTAGAVVLSTPAMGLRSVGSEGGRRHGAGTTSPAAPAATSTAVIRA